jgi:hypothetical protein
MILTFRQEAREPEELEHQMEEINEQQLSKR